MSTLKDCLEDSLCKENDRINEISRERFLTLCRKTKIHLEPSKELQYAQDLLNTVISLGNSGDAQLTEFCVDNGLSDVINVFDAVLGLPFVQQAENNTFVELLLDAVNSLSESSKKASSVLVPQFFGQFIDLLIQRSGDFSHQMEILKSTNVLLENCPIIIKEDLLKTKGTKEILSRVASMLRTVGDYEFQIGIVECLFRAIPRKIRDFAECLFENKEILQKFLQVRDWEFETDCRLFLNELNTNLSANQSVLSVPCLTAFLGDKKVCKPEDAGYDSFWVDFNTGSQRVTLFCEQFSSSQNSTDGLWDTLSVWKKDVKKFQVLVADECQVANITFVKPVRSIYASQQDVNGNVLQIQFSNTYHIEEALSRTFGHENETIKYCKKVSVAKNPVLLQKDMESLDSSQSTSKHQIPASSFKQSCSQMDTRSQRSNSSRMKVSVPSVLMPDVLKASSSQQSVHSYNSQCANNNSFKKSCSQECIKDCIPSPASSRFSRMSEPLSDVKIRVKERPTTPNLNSKTLPRARVKTPVVTVTPVPRAKKCSKKKRSGNEAEIKNASGKGTNTTDKSATSKEKCKESNSEFLELESIPDSYPESLPEVQSSAPQPRNDEEDFYSTQIEAKKISRPEKKTYGNKSRKSSRRNRQDNNKKTHLDKTECDASLKGKLRVQQSQPEIRDGQTESCLDTADLKNKIKDTKIGQKEENEDEMPSSQKEKSKIIITGPNSECGKETKTEKSVNCKETSQSRRKATKIWQKEENEDEMPSSQKEKLPKSKIINTGLNSECGKETKPEKSVKNKETSQSKKKATKIWQIEENEDEMPSSQKEKLPKSKIINTGLNSESGKDTKTEKSVKNKETSQSKKKATKIWQIEENEDEMPSSQKEKLPKSKIINTGLNSESGKETKTENSVKCKETPKNRKQAEVSSSKQFTNVGIGRLTGQVIQIEQHNTEEEEKEDYEDDEVVTIPSTFENNSDSLAGDNKEAGVNERKIEDSKILTENYTSQMRGTDRNNTTKTMKGRNDNTGSRSNENKTKSKNRIVEEKHCDNENLKSTSRKSKNGKEKRKNENKTEVGTHNNASQETICRNVEGRQMVEDQFNDFDNCDGNIQLHDLDKDNRKEKNISTNTEEPSQNSELASVDECDDKRSKSKGQQKNQHINKCYDSTIACTSDYKENNICSKEGKGPEKKFNNKINKTISQRPFHRIIADNFGFDSPECIMSSGDSCTYGKEKRKMNENMEKSVVLYMSYSASKSSQLPSEKGDCISDPYDFEVECKQSAAELEFTERHSISNIKDTKVLKTSKLKQKVKQQRKRRPVKRVKDKVEPKLNNSYDKIVESVCTNEKHKKQKTHEISLSTKGTFQNEDFHTGLDSDADRKHRSKKPEELPSFSYRNDEFALTNKGNSSENIETSKNDSILANFSRLCQEIVAGDADGIETDDGSSKANCDKFTDECSTHAESGTTGNKSSKRNRSKVKSYVNTPKTPVGRRHYNVLDISITKTPKTPKSDLEGVITDSQKSENEAVDQVTSKRARRKRKTVDYKDLTDSDPDICSTAKNTKRKFLQMSDDGEDLSRINEPSEVSWIVNRSLKKNLNRKTYTMKRMESKLGRGLKDENTGCEEELSSNSSRVVDDLEYEVQSNFDLDIKLNGITSGPSSTVRSSIGGNSVIDLDSDVTDDEENLSRLQPKKLFKEYKTSKIISHEHYKPESLSGQSFEDAMTQSTATADMEMESETGMSALVRAFGSDIQQQIQTRRHNMEKITKSVLKSTRKHINKAWFDQHDYRSQVVEKFGNQLMEEVFALEKDTEILRESELKTHTFFKEQLDILQRCRTCQEQRLLKLRKLKQSFMKHLEKADELSMKKQDTVVSVLKNDLSTLQRKVLVETQKEEMANVKRKLQSMFLYG